MQNCKIRAFKKLGLGSLQQQMLPDCCTYDEFTNWLRRWCNDGSGNALLTHVK